MAVGGDALLSPPETDESGHSSCVGRPQPTAVADETDRARPRDVGIVRTRMFMAPQGFLDLLHIFYGCRRPSLQRLSRKSACEVQKTLLRASKRFRGNRVDIGFTDAKLLRLFNEFILLRDRYGDGLAEVIATRVGVLRGARNLGLVPQRPPISLRPVEGSLVDFTVDLRPPRKLRFGACNCGPGEVVLDQVEMIEIFGVE
jgi:hypothetical protein